MLCWVSFPQPNLRKMGVAESRYEIIINRRGAEDAEEKERASFYLFMSQLCNALNRNLF